MWKEQKKTFKNDARLKKLAADGNLHLNRDLNIFNCFFMLKVNLYDINHPIVLENIFTCGHKKWIIRFRLFAFSSLSTPGLQL